MYNKPILSKELITRYDTSGPRYTSYPTAVQFHQGFGSEQYKEIARETNQETDPRPLSLYFHLPFCSTVCYYCACNKIITRNRAHAEPYLENLYREIAMQGELFDRQRKVEQLHWGGGTPTFISHDQMQEVMRQTGEYFTLLDDDSGEYSIELDPREVSGDTIPLLRSIGFNRVSLGVQDFDPEVQKAVNRIQSEEITLSVIEAARKEGFKSISVDLIYGLPLQSAASFERTLQKVLDMEVDRLSIFNYAHMPDRFKTQKQIYERDLPGASEKLKILQSIINLLTDAGYLYIGMDHFAKPEDELSVAQREGHLTRNFQGYSTHGNCDIVGMGITAIGKIGNCYSQNVTRLEEYAEAINSGAIPVYRGVELDDDDLLRRHVITQLICHFQLEFDKVESRYSIHFKDYFNTELGVLQDMERDGLLKLGDGYITVSPRGRLLIRNICMVFDKYLHQEGGKKIFSRVI